MSLSGYKEHTRFENTVGREDQGYFIQSAYKQPTDQCAQEQIQHPSNYTHEHVLATVEIVCIEIYLQMIVLILKCYLETVSSYLTG